MLIIHEEATTVVSDYALELNTAISSLCRFVEAGVGKQCMVLAMGDLSLFAHRPILTLQKIGDAIRQTAGGTVSKYFISLFCIIFLPSFFQGAQVCIVPPLLLSSQQSCEVGEAEI